MWARLSRAVDSGISWVLYSRLDILVGWPLDCERTFHKVSKLEINRYWYVFSVERLMFSVLVSIVIPQPRIKALTNKITRAKRRFDGD